MGGYSGYRGIPYPYGTSIGKMDDPSDSPRCAYKATVGGDDIDDAGDVGSGKCCASNS